MTTCLFRAAESRNRLTSDGKDHSHMDFLGEDLVVDDALTARTPPQQQREERSSWFNVSDVIEGIAFPSPTLCVASRKPAEEVADRSPVPMMMGGVASPRTIRIPGQFTLRNLPDDLLTPELELIFGPGAEASTQQQQPSSPPATPTPAPAPPPTPSPPSRLTAANTAAAAAHRGGGAMHVAAHGRDSTEPADTGEPNRDEPGGAPLASVGRVRRRRPTLTIGDAEGLLVRRRPDGRGPRRHFAPKASRVPDWSRPRPSPAT